MVLIVYFCYCAGEVRTCEDWDGVSKNFAQWNTIKARVKADFHGTYLHTRYCLIWKGYTWTSSTCWEKTLLQNIAIIYSHVLFLDHQSCRCTSSTYSKYFNPDRYTKHCTAGVSSLPAQGTASSFMNTVTHHKYLQIEKDLKGEIKFITGAASSHFNDLKNLVREKRTF